MKSRNRYPLRLLFKIIIMRKYVYLVVLTGVFLSLCRCVIPVKMTISNCSSETIFFYLSCDDNLQDSTYRFLEIGKTKNGKSTAEPSYVDKSNELQKLNPQEGSIIRIFGSRRKPCLPCENKELHIFLFSPETVNSNTWETIKENNLFDKHLIFSEDKLRKLKWKLTISDDLIGESFD